MKKLSSIVLVLTLFISSCMVTRPEKASIFGVSGVQTSQGAQYLEYRYYLYITPNLDRCVVRYIVGEDIIWTDRENIRTTYAKHNIGVPFSFEINQDIPVKAQFRCYLRTSQNTSASLTYEYTFE